MLVVGRSNRATPAMLARCGVLLALAVELAERADRRGTDRLLGTEEGDFLELYSMALGTRGSGPESRAYRLILDAMNREPDARDGE